MSSEHGKPKTYQLTEEDRARHRAIREKFKDSPSYDELVARGEIDPDNTVMTGTFWLLTVFTATLRAERERQGLSLADVSERSGIDRATISKLETHKSLNPTIDTLCRYAAALGKDIGLTLEEHRPMQARRITVGNTEKKGAGPS